MKSWGRMLWALLSGPGRKGGIQSWAFSSWPPHSPLAGLVSATQLVSHWTTVFEERGIPEARESSEYIVAHVLGAKTFQSLRPALWTQPLTPQQLQCIQELSSLRLQRMPVQYILGEWDFQGLNLKMVPPVFIPRPETEELIDWVLEEEAQRPCTAGAQDGPVILEVGCGSGAIALSLLSRLPREYLRGMGQRRDDRAPHQLAIVTASGSHLYLSAKPWPRRREKGYLTFPSSPERGLGGRCFPSLASSGTLQPLYPSLFLRQSQVIAVDKEDAAICLTQENAQRLQLQDRIRIVPLDVTLEKSWTHLLPWGPMDLVISNPPYVFHQDMEQLAPEICRYEDLAALDGGKEGMDVITHILALAPQLLKDFGSVFLEVDPRHPELVSSWLRSRPDLHLYLVAVRKDFCGRPRFLHIRRSGPQCGCPVDT